MSATLAEDDGPYRRPIPPLTSSGPYSASDIAAARGTVVACLRGGCIEILSAPQGRVVLIEKFLTDLATLNDPALTRVPDPTGDMLVIGHRWSTSGRVVYRVVDTVPERAWTIAERVA